MPCYHPIPATIEYEGQQPPYKRRMKLHPAGEPTKWLACQICVGCREQQQQHMAIRVKHEARYYEDKQFLTLTYDDKYLPDGLVKAHMQKFNKKLRHRALEKLKSLHCGEYGDETQRPHYHAAVLGNILINDYYRWNAENKRSPTLDAMWGLGMVTVGELTDDRINYVAGYVLKKAGYQKQIYCTPDGEELQAPYRETSNGLGKRWIQEYKNDLRNGTLIDQGANYSIPRYYKNKIKETDTALDSYIQDKQAEKWKPLTPEDRKLLHNGEKIRLKQIRETKSRKQV